MEGDLIQAGGDVEPIVSELFLGNLLVDFPRDFPFLRSRYILQGVPAAVGYTGDYPGLGRLFRVEN